jgi:hypothetical protein
LQRREPQHSNYGLFMLGNFAHLLQTRNVGEKLARVAAEQGPIDPTFPPTSPISRASSTKLRITAFSAAPFSCGRWRSFDNPASGSLQQPDQLHIAARPLGQQ